MTDREAEDIWLDNIVEINELWESIGELIYIQIKSNLNLDYRNKEAKRKFGMALAKLRLVKPRRRHGKDRAARS